MYPIKGYKKTERKLIPWAWMATEYLQTGEFRHEKSDVWSFGVTLWEIFSLGNKPYGFGMRTIKGSFGSVDILLHFADSYEETKVKILNGKRLECPDTMELIEGGEAVYNEVMRSCWAARPEDRPGVAALVSALGGFLGEAGRRQYEAAYTDYMAQLPLIHRGHGENAEVETDPASASSGYIDPATAAPDTGYIQISEVQQNPAGEGGGNPYIQLSEAAGELGQHVSRDQGYSHVSPELGQHVSPDRGYSRLTSTEGGYIQLSPLNTHNKQ